MLTTAQPSQALVPLKDTSAQPKATTNGAEQGDVRCATGHTSAILQPSDPNHPDKVLAVRVHEKGAATAKVSS